MSQTYTGEKALQKNYATFSCNCAARTSLYATATSFFSIRPGDAHLCLKF
nr:MAG TPA: hypothetical protein [Caudoviricetes sp.]DAM31205.1 MAG TPA: hypothetical protein [Caudoviricetes sp.]